MRQTTENRICFNRHRNDLDTGKVIPAPYYQSQPERQECLKSWYYERCRPNIEVGISSKGRKFTKGIHNDDLHLPVGLGPHSKRADRPDQQRIPGGVNAKFSNYYNCSVRNILANASAFLPGNSTIYHGKSDRYLTTDNTSYINLVRENYSTMDSPPPIPSAFPPLPTVAPPPPPEFFAETAELGTAGELLTEFLIDVRADGDSGESDMYLGELNDASKTGGHLEDLAGIYIDPMHESLLLGENIPDVPDQFKDELDGPFCLTLDELSEHHTASDDECDDLQTDPEAPVAEVCEDAEDSNSAISAGEDNSLIDLSEPAVTKQADSIQSSLVDISPQISVNSLESTRLDQPETIGDCVTNQPVLLSHQHEAKSEADEALTDNLEEISWALPTYQLDNPPLFAPRSKVGSAPDQKVPVKTTQMSADKCAETKTTLLAGDDSYCGEAEGNHDGGGFGVSNEQLIEKSATNQLEEELWNEIITSPTHKHFVNGHPYNSTTTVRNMDTPAKKPVIPPKPKSLPKTEAPPVVKAKVKPPVPKKPVKRVLSQGGECVKAPDVTTDSSTNPAPGVIIVTQAVVDEKTLHAEIPTHSTGNTDSARVSDSAWARTRWQEDEFAIERSEYTAVPVGERHGWRGEGAQNKEDTHTTSPEMPQVNPQLQITLNTQPVVDLVDLGGNSHPYDDHRDNEQPMTEDKLQPSMPPSISQERSPMDTEMVSSVKMIVEEPTDVHPTEAYQPHSDEVSGSLCSNRSSSASLGSLTTSEDIYPEKSHQDTVGHVKHLPTQYVSTAKTSLYSRVKPRPTLSKATSIVEELERKQREARSAKFKGLKVSRPTADNTADKRKGSVGNIVILPAIGGNTAPTSDVLLRSQTSTNNTIKMTGTRPSTLLRDRPVSMYEYSRPENTSGSILTKSSLDSPLRTEQKKELPIKEPLQLNGRLTTTARASDDKAKQKTIAVDDRIQEATEVEKEKALSHIEPKNPIQQSHESKDYSVRPSINFERQPEKNTENVVSARPETRDTKKPFVEQVEKKTLNDLESAFDNFHPPSQPINISTHPSLPPPSAAVGPEELMDSLIDLSETSSPPSTLSIQVPADYSSFPYDYGTTSPDAIHDPLDVRGSSDWSTSFQSDASTPGNEFSPRLSSERTWKDGQALSISKEDISEGRGSSISTPDPDIDAPRSPTNSEADSGIFSKPEKNPHDSVKVTPTDSVKHISDIDIPGMGPPLLTSLHIDSPVLCVSSPDEGKTSHSPRDFHVTTESIRSEPKESRAVHEYVTIKEEPPTKYSHRDSAVSQGNDENKYKEGRRTTLEKTAPETVPITTSPQAAVASFETKNYRTAREEAIVEKASTKDVKGEISGSAGPASDDETIEVEFVKGSVGLGFCIEGGRGSPMGDLPVSVKKIFKGNSSVQGVLQAGDQILEVNGESIGNMSHYTAWNYLKSAPEGTVKLRIKKNMMS